MNRSVRIVGSPEVIPMDGTSANRTNGIRSVCYCGLALPEPTDQGELPPGVHLADWRGFQARFCSSSPRRVWLSGRLRTLLALAATNGKLHRVFIWGSFATAKPAPKDLDILLVMDEVFEVDERKTGQPGPSDLLDWVAVTSGFAPQDQARPDASHSSGRAGRGRRIIPG